MDIDNLDKIIEYSFGVSSYVFFKNINYCDNMSFDEHKEMFFRILEYLLKEKKIYLITPGIDIYRTPTHIPKFSIFDKETHWNVSQKEAVRYSQERWPKKISNVRDVELVYFLYEMPGIIWIADDGSLHSS